MMSNAEPLPDRRALESDSGRFGAGLPKLVADVAREVTASAVASRIATSFVRTLGARSARVYLTSADRATLELAGAAGIDPPAAGARPSVSAEDDLPLAEAVRLGLVQVSDVTFSRAPGTDARLRSGVALALPLFAGPATIGAVSVTFDDLAVRDCADLSVMSASLGALLDGARLRDELARLEALGRRREERIALVIHELRQPLQLLLVAAGLLERRSTGEEQRALERLRSGGRRLDGLISDLSDVSFLESGRFALRIASTDLTRLVETFIGRVAPTARVSVDGEIPRMVVDPRRIEQVLANLLGNAQKYGRGERALRVVVARRDRVVVVSVANEGDGIPEDERTKVFEPYYRGRARSPETRGQGLGLYICRMLVEEHGGRIWTDGDASHTRFSFSLPVSEPAERVSEMRCVAARSPSTGGVAPTWEAQ